MTAPAENPFDSLLEEFRQVVREEIAAALQNGGTTNSQPDVTRQSQISQDHCHFEM
jgi:hypothetical protein